MYQFKTNLAEFEALDCRRDGGWVRERECVACLPEGARVETTLRQHHGLYVFNSVIVTKIRYIHCKILLYAVWTTARMKHSLAVGFALTQSESTLCRSVTLMCVEPSCLKANDDRGYKQRIIVIV